MENGKTWSGIHGAVEEELGSANTVWVLIWIQHIKTITDREINTNSGRVASQAVHLPFYFEIEDMPPFNVSLC